MVFRVVTVPCAVALALAPAESVTAKKWTFCVASESAAKDVWITDVFSSATRRESLEVELKAMLKRPRNLSEPRPPMMLARQSPPTRARRLAEPPLDARAAPSAFRAVNFPRWRRRRRAAHRSKQAPPLAWATERRLAAEFLKRLHRRAAPDL